MSSFDKLTSALSLPTLPVPPSLHRGAVGEPTPTSVEAAEEHGCPKGCPCHAAKAPEGQSGTGGPPSPQDAPSSADETAGI